MSRPNDLSQLSMFELFRLEAETQSATLGSGLLELENGAAPGPVLEKLMRAAHSLKGAARIVNLPTAVRIAHAMEDCFVAAQQGSLSLSRAEIDLLLRGADLLALLPKRTEDDLAEWENDCSAEISEFLHARARLVSARPAERRLPVQQPPAAQPPADVKAQAAAAPLPPATALEPPEPAERVLRLAAENLNRLLGLAGESLVESRWLRPFAESLQRLKRRQGELARKLDQLHQVLQDDPASERAKSYLNELFQQLADTQQFLADRMQELDLFDRRSAQHSQRLYLEVLRTRMRPFSDVIRRFPRLVRDLARNLGKEVKLEIAGLTTQVDRDILERLEIPLAHLLRNAVDHGCEPPEVRQRAGKPAEALLRLEAHHSAGMLLVTVADDGAGVPLDCLRKAIVKKGLAPAAVAEKLPDAELLEFLFLPGFSLRDSVTEISGRGVGLDVVQNMVRSVHGAIRLQNQPGRGLRVQLQLPLTLSVVRALLVEVAGEPYAIPLSHIVRTLKLPHAGIASLEGRLHFQFAGQQVGLLTAHQVLDCARPATPILDWPVVVVGDRSTRYGLVVDRFLGERELVVQPLDPRLGKLQDISAAALMEDGAPVLIVDVEEMVRSIEKLLADGRLAQIQLAASAPSAPKPKRVLAVDDSLAVRELERKLLSSRGFQANVAVDGMDAWNAVRTGQYNLVITDIDMPRLDGIELAKLIKQDPRLKALPVLVVSYKDLEQDRLRGLQAGADYYLTKGSFSDESLLQAVVDLIGDPAPTLNEPGLPEPRTLPGPANVALPGVL